MRFIEEIQSSGGKVYEVGGTVRDRLMGRDQKDRDLLIIHLPINDLIKILKRHGEVFTVGKSFGVIKFYPKQSERALSGTDLLRPDKRSERSSHGEIDEGFGGRAESPPDSYDIALPRKEVSTGTGHRDFNVDFDPNLPVEIDLSRRDFTVNAMAREINTGRLIDPFGGENDLKKSTLRMVSQTAFEEDPLRMLRGIQFAARFHLTIEPGTFEAMQRQADLIRTVSAERVSEELKKLFMAEKPSAGFILMRDAGLLKPLFPELAENVGVEQGNKFRDDDVFMHTMRVLDASRKDAAIPYAGDLELMLAALFHDVGKARTKRFNAEKNRMTFYGHQLLSKRMAKKRMNVLKITTLGVDPDRVAHLVEHHMFQTKAHFTDRSIRRFVNKIGPEHILKLVDLRLADNRGGKYPEGIKGVLRLRKKIQEEIDKKTPFGVRDLAVRGDDLMGIGIPEGPEIGRVLKELVEVILDDPEKNVKETLLEIAKEKAAHPGQDPTRAKNEEEDPFAPEEE